MRFHPKRGLVFGGLTLATVFIMLGVLQQLEVFQLAQTVRSTSQSQQTLGNHQQQQQPSEEESQSQNRHWVRDDTGLRILQGEDTAAGAEKPPPKTRKKLTLKDSNRSKPAFIRKQQEALEVFVKRNRTFAPAASVRPSVKPESLWPDPARPWDDRIVAQLEYVPESYKNNKDPPLKTIYLPGGPMGPMGRDYFKEFKCPVDACYLTDKVKDAQDADAVVFGQEGYVSKIRSPNQIWILFLLESPLNTGPFDAYKDRVNWTATYRMDSTLVTPYEKFVFYKNATATLREPPKNYAAGKKKLIAWFVSNCGARNQRLEYVNELRKYIQVDIYGNCGNLTCPRFDKRKCSDMLKKEYRFYLSFENSNCQYYITEKFYQNALWNEVVPVVMGARRDDYLAGAPPHSFIHVEDFESPRELANYLTTLHHNDNLYNEYHQWRTSGQFINTKFWCRVCALLHDDTSAPRWYESINSWWRQKGICTRQTWGDEKNYVSDWNLYL